MVGERPLQLLQALGDDKNYYNFLIRETEAFLNELWNSEYGCWFRGKPSNLIKINGAMKVWSGLHWLDRPSPDCHKLMDLACSSLLRQMAVDL